MSDFNNLFNRYLSEERLDCKKYLSHHLMTNRVERPSEYLMDEFARRALELEAKVKELEDRRDDLEATLGIVFFCNDIKDHFPETHKMVERVLKESK